MVANWWFALIIMVVLNGILVWTLFVELEPISRRAKKWFFIVVNVTGLVLAVSQFFWMDF